MKKEKWLLKEIESWQACDIIDKELADRLKMMYTPKKSIGLLMILFSIIGSVLIGMGIVLVCANNWWYSLPIFVRTFIGFSPLIVSQAVVLYTYRHKMSSTAFRESASLLNVAGVFASIAIVGQIFHLPGDFTNYLLLCGLLFLPTMLIMNAISPLIIYYWTAINGGVYFSDDAGIIISVLMFAVGAVFVLKKCTLKNGTSVYLSLVTAVSLFFLILMAGLKCDCDLSVILCGFSLLLLSVSTMLKGCKYTFDAVGKISFIISAFVFTYQGMWNYTADFNNQVFAIITALLILFAVTIFLENVMAKKCDVFSFLAACLLFIRGVWYIFGLTEAPYDVIFVISSNVILFALSILCIFEGIRKIDLYNANIGMVVLCTLIVLRFFDSELPLSARGVAFLILGTGFLLFNLHLVKSKKRILEEKI